MNTTEIKRIDDLPQIIDDVTRCNLGFVVTSGKERTVLRFGEITPQLRMELEILADEFRPVSRAA